MTTLSSSPMVSGSNIPSIRSREVRRKPFVTATGSPATRLSKALYYLLKAYDYRHAWRHESSEGSLLKVVCNLRNFHLQDRDSTVRLVTTHFNPRMWREWSPEAVGIAWDLVEGFTPALGLRDPKARDKQRKVALEDEVLHLLAWVEPGGRTLDKDLLKVFREWNPHLRVTAHAFTRAVGDLLGQQKLRSSGKGYWVGFHLPTPEECAGRGGQAA